MTNNLNNHIAKSAVELAQAYRHIDFLEDKVKSLEDQLAAKIKQIEVLSPTSSEGSDKKIASPFQSRVHL